MKKSLLLPSAILVIVLALVAIALQFVGDKANGAAFTGTAAYQQFATTTSVGPDTKVRIFAERTDGACKARVITTRETQIFFLFADPTTGDLASTTMTRLNTPFQSASTTATYDAELYGCGRMWALAPATTTIVTIEF